MSLASDHLRNWIEIDKASWKKRQVGWTQLARRKVRGVYDSDTARRTMLGVVNHAAQRYAKDKRLTESWSLAFPAPDREHAARELERQFRAGWSRGELDHLLPAKLRPKRRGMAGNPIRAGYSKAVLRDNIGRLVREGRTAKQAVAIAFETARATWAAEHPGKALPDHLGVASKKKASKKKASKKASKKTSKKASKKASKKKASKKKASKKKASKKKASKKSRPRSASSAGTSTRR